MKIVFQLQNTRMVYCANLLALIASIFLVAFPADLTAEEYPWGKPPNCKPFPVAYLHGFDGNCYPIPKDAVARAYEYCRIQNIASGGCTSSQPNYYSNGPQGESIGCTIVPASTSCTPMRKDYSTGRYKALDYCEQTSTAGCYSMLRGQCDNSGECHQLHCGDLDKDGVPECGTGRVCPKYNLGKGFYSKDSCPLDCNDRDPLIGDCSCCPKGWTNFLSEYGTKDFFNQIGAPDDVLDSCDICNEGLSCSNAPSAGFNEQCMRMSGITGKRAYFGTKEKEYVLAQIQAQRNLLGQLEREIQRQYKIWGINKDGKVDYTARIDKSAAEVIDIIEESRMMSYAWRASEVTKLWMIELSSPNSEISLALKAYKQEATSNHLPPTIVTNDALNVSRPSSYVISNTPQWANSLFDIACMHRATCTAKEVRAVLLEEHKAQLWEISQAVEEYPFLKGTELMRVEEYGVDTLLSGLQGRVNGYLLGKAKAIQSKKEELEKFAAYLTCRNPSNWSIDPMITSIVLSLPELPDPEIPAKLAPTDQGYQQRLSERKEAFRARKIAAVIRARRDLLRERIDIDKLTKDLFKETAWALGTVAITGGSGAPALLRLTSFAKGMMTANQTQAVLQLAERFQTIQPAITALYLAKSSFNLIQLPGKMRSFRAQVAECSKIIHEGNFSNSNTRLDKYLECMRSARKSVINTLYFAMSQRNALPQSAGGSLAAALVIKNLTDLNLKASEATSWMLRLAQKGHILFDLGRIKLINGVLSCHHPFCKVPVNLIIGTFKPPIPIPSGAKISGPYRSSGLWTGDFIDVNWDEGATQALTRMIPGLVTGERLSIRMYFHTDANTAASWRLSLFTSKGVEYEAVRRMGCNGTGNSLGSNLEQFDFVTRDKFMASQELRDFGHFRDWDGE